MKRNKICVYAICKNELKFVDSWLESMSEADCIVVLDTGSTDGTYEKLKSDKRVTLVEQKEIKPWRFDVARNESMKLVPDDCNILVCTDFDERFEKGWADVVRSEWEEDTTVINYLYAWKHNDAGEVEVPSIYMKIHDRNYHWIYPVHELLVPIEPDFEPHEVDVLDGRIYLHHWQDDSKPRGYYFDLLKLAVEEYPNDVLPRTFLGREYLFKGEYEEGLKHYIIALGLPDMYAPDKPLVILDSLLYMIGAYEELHDWDNAIKYCLKFLEIRTDFRDPYFFLGEIYNIKGLYTLAEACALEGFKYGINHHCYVEKHRAYTGWGNEVLGIAQFHLGRYEEAKENFEESLKHNPNYQVIKDYYNDCIKLLNQ